MAKETALRVCKHGSTYCGVCFHNLASAIALPGRPKYGPRISTGKPKKSKKNSNKEVPYDSGVRK
jgi:hypothetical protein